MQLFTFHAAIEVEAASEEAARSASIGLLEVGHSGANENLAGDRVQIVRTSLQPASGLVVAMRDIVNDLEDGQDWQSALARANSALAYEAKAEAVAESATVTTLRAAIAYYREGLAQIIATAPEEDPTVPDDDNFENVVHNDIEYGEDRARWEIRQAAQFTLENAPDAADHAVATTGD